jgi:hypothetical protein
VRHRGGPEPQLREDGVVFDRMTDLSDGHRRRGEVRVDVVLIATPMPGDHHFRPYPAHVVLAANETFPGAIYRGLPRSRWRRFESLDRIHRRPPLA